MAGSQPGQVMVLFALSFAAMFAAAAAMVDIVLIARDTAQLRTAAAAAARAGASQISGAALSGADMFTIDGRDAQTAAQAVCAAYAREMGDLTCDVSIGAPIPADGLAVDAMVRFEMLDNTRGWPGLTVHMAVNVTAHHRVRLFLLPVLLGGGHRFSSLSVAQSAVLVSGQ